MSHMKEDSDAMAAAWARDVLAGAGDISWVKTDRFHPGTSTFVG